MPAVQQAGAMSGRRLDVAWVAFAVVCLGVMSLGTEYQTLPFHLLWLSLALVFAVRVWPRPWTTIALVFVTVSTTVVMMTTGKMHGDDMPYMFEIPLMGAVFAAMVWHARRAQRAIAGLAEAHERERMFLRDASHSLRTPVTVAFGHAEAARDALPEDSTAHGDLEVVLDELQRLSRTSDRLLALAAADHPEFLMLEPLDPAALVEEVAHRWTVASGRRVHAEAAPGVGHVVADRERVRAALDALIENALRSSAMTEPVTLALTHTDHEIGFEVRDHGFGIAPDDLERLFEPFARASGQVRGTGLGLAIVRAIAEAHRGSVDVQSAPGRGSVFTLRLGRPARAAPGPARARIALVAHNA